MDEIENALGLNENSQKDKIISKESIQPHKSSSLGNNAAESILASFSYTLLVIGVIAAITTGVIVSEESALLSWLCFFGISIFAIILWASLMVIVNISNNLRQIKKHLQGRQQTKKHLLKRI